MFIGINLSRSGIAVRAPGMDPFLCRTYQWERPPSGWFVRRAPIHSSGDRQAVMRLIGRPMQTDLT